jgi:hypothetical protein
MSRRCHKEKLAMVNKNALSPQEIEDLFVKVPPVPANTFEFALVMGGTVSAGAFTAGVVDFLIEALDSWTALRAQADAAAPTHNTVLRVITGTSGGGVNAAITARALAYEFPHVTRATANWQAGTGNPFFDVWVNTLTLNDFLATSDIDGGKFVSLLNGAPIDKGATQAANFTAPGLRPRPYLADPLRVVLTLTNLRGVPYKTDLGNGLSETFIDHGDYARFALVYPSHSIVTPRPDEFVLSFDNRQPQAINWDMFSVFARATAAFPIGFPARELVRPVEHYRYRIAVVPPAGAAPPTLVGRLPDWEALTPPGAPDVPEDYRFLTVDGGATDNEPIELARTVLAGATGRNPRDPKTANRAVLLVDPFAGQATLGPETMPGLVPLLGSLVSTFTQQTRYDSHDLLLAADPNVFSRFMVVPQRDGKTGGDAIAANGLGAFIGFACPAFMRHDFLLGRKNCQDFLRSQFVLHEDNPVFAGAWTAAQKQQHQVLVDGQVHLPLIPLLGDAAIPETQAAWPKHQLNPDSYHEAIEARFKAAVEFEGSAGAVSSSLAWIIAHFGENTVANLAVNKMKQALKDADLA